MSDQSMTEEYADTMVTALTELWEAIDNGAEYDGYPDGYEYLDQWPLEIVREVGRPFTILLSFGGPNTRIESYADGSNAVIEVAWGSNVARRYAESVDRTAEYFAGFYEGE